MSDIDPTGTFCPRCSGLLVFGPSPAPDDVGRCDCGVRIRWKEYLELEEANAARWGRTAESPPEPREAE